MTTTVRKIITVSVPEEELRQALVNFVRNSDPEIRKVLGTTQHSIEVEFQIKAGDYDQMTGQPRALVRGADLMIEVEEK